MDSQLEWVGRENAGSTTLQRRLYETGFQMNLALAVRTEKADPEILSSFLFGTASIFTFN